MMKLDVDPDIVRMLAGLLDETGLTEIEYETGEDRIRIARNLSAAAPLAVAAQAPAAAQPADAAAEAPHPGTVAAPMVGTIYVAAEPGGPPFVSVGDTVRQGEKLLLIEAMKTFNEIRAPQAGRIIAIHVTDGQPVEFGEALLVIE